MNNWSLFIAALQVAFVLSLAAEDTASLDGIIVRADDCPTTNSRCLTCQQGVVCTFGLPRYINCSSCEHVCKFDSALNPPQDPSCSGYYDGNFLMNAACFCRSDAGDDIYLEDGDYADPYEDISAYITCAAGNPTYKTCNAGQIFSEGYGCLTVDECPDSTSKLEIPGMCEYYLDCSTSTIESCPAGTIFYGYHPSDSIQGCYDPNDVCGVSTPSVFFQDPNVCYLYHACIAPTDAEPIVTNCCPLGTVYDPTTLQCTKVETCPQVGICVEAFWEMMECSECSSLSAGYVYASRQPCSEYYYECVDMDGTLMPGLMKCPASFPIFNPAMGYCDTAINVTGC